MDGVDEPVLEDPREVVHDEPRAVRAQRLVVELQRDLPLLLRGPALRQEEHAGGGDEQEHERRHKEEGTPGTSGHGDRLLVLCVCVLKRGFPPPPCFLFLTLTDPW